MTALHTLPWETLDDRTTVAARLSAGVAREIVEGRYAAGTLLTEAQLAEAADCSRTPAREAMLQLSRWKLVTLLPKKGALVTTVTAQDRRDLLDLRTMFEINAVAGLADPTDADPAPAEDPAAASDLDSLAEDLRSLLDAQKDALDSADPLAFASADYAFHARIIRQAHNAVVDEVLAELGPRLARLTFRAIQDNPEALTTMHEEHAQLVDHARAGEVAGFAALVTRHVEAGHFTGYDA